MCACARALAPPGRTLTRARRRRRGRSRWWHLGRLAARVRRRAARRPPVRAHVERAPRRERARAELRNPVERSTSIVDAGRLVASGDICVFDDDDDRRRGKHHLRTTFKSDESRVRVTLRTTRTVAPCRRANRGSGSPSRPAATCRPPGRWQSSPPDPRRVAHLADADAGRHGRGRPQRHVHRIGGAPAPAR